MQHAPISRVRYMQENRKMRFQEAYDGWSQGRLTQAEAALCIEVKLLPAQYIRAYVKRNKTDAADAAALLEAARASDIRPVRVKSVGQQALQGMHRIRSLWMSAGSPAHGCGGSQASCRMKVVNQAAFLRISDSLVWGVCGLR